MHVRALELASAKRQTEVVMVDDEEAAVGAVHGRDRTLHERLLETLGLERAPLKLFEFSRNRTHSDNSLRRSQGFERSPHDGADGNAIAAASRATVREGTEPTAHPPDISRRIQHETPEHVASVF